MPDLGPWRSKRQHGLQAQYPDSEGRVTILAIPITELAYEMATLGAETVTKALDCPNVPKGANGTVQQPSCSRP
jgi:hypothetical protein